MKTLTTLETYPGLGYFSVILKVLDENGLIVEVKSCTDAESVEAHIQRYEENYKLVITQIIEETDYAKVTYSMTPRN